MIEFMTKLYAHQRAAVDKLGKLKVGALYMEQGTGKTRTALELIKLKLDADKINAVLWLCPCSVKRNLHDDIVYHCGEMPQNIVIKGIESLSSSDRLYIKLLKLVSTYNTALIVDESNLVKNQVAKRTLRITEIAKKCQYKYILNGTPVSRTEADLFAQWYMLDWRILGYKSYYSFAANHLEYVEVKSATTGEWIQTDRIARVLNIDYLSKKIAPYSYQVTKDKCLDLPPKKHEYRFFMLTDEQEYEYQRVKSIFLDAVSEFKPETIYRLFTALQHVSSGRQLTSELHHHIKTSSFFKRATDNPRVQCLADTLRQIGDEQAIIFVKYKYEIGDVIAAIRGENATYSIFNGDLNLKKRLHSLGRFKSGEVKYLISNKTCGAYGLNLQYCHNIIYYDNDFDWATRAQSEDRVHRIGQNHVVNIYDISAINASIDKFICNCLARKESMVDGFKNHLEEIKAMGAYGQINIGYDNAAKEIAIKDYAKKHKIEHIIIFHSKKFDKLIVKDAEFVEFEETIMYRTFYPLLEKIDDTYLLVFDECMRLKKRNELHYNCMHHYCNQTIHKLVFEYFPFIDEPDDFMILASFINPPKYKRAKISDEILDQLRISCIDRSLQINCIQQPASDSLKEQYEAEKKHLFDNLRQKDPSTIPNKLALLTEKHKNPKGKAIGRVKKANVESYTKFTNGISWQILSFPTRQLVFNDFCKIAGARNITYISTGLPIDEYIIGQYKDWNRRVRAFVTQAGLPKEERAKSSKRTD